MGNAGRHHAPPYRPLPQTTTPTAPAREATIPPGGTATAAWDFRGYRGVEVEVSNIGRAACAFDGPTGEDYLLPPGKVVVLSVRDGCGEFALPITSARGTQVRLAVVAWRAPTFILSKRRVIERNPDHTIASITEIPVWVMEEGR